MSFKMERN